MGPLRIAAVASISLLAACGGGVQVGSSSAPLDWTVPMGTYESSSPSIGKLKRIVLMADETAHLEEVPVCRGSLPCNPVLIDSFYVRTGTEISGHLDFRNGNGQLLRAYDYQYDGVTLGILPEGDPDFQALAKSPVAWCAVASQCAQQWLPTPLCSGGWTCVDNACQFKCGGF